MDNLRAFDEEQSYDAGIEEPVMERPPEIGVDERRMHVRAYNYWVSLLNGRPYPAIEDVEPAELDDFGPHSVLLDFSMGSDDPAIVFIGRALREECGLDGSIKHISDVPGRSLLSRLTDHYLQIIANCAPIGFEAEFMNERGHNTLYRGILMPLSSDGETIDFIHGVINWKELADRSVADAIEREVGRAADAPSLADASPIWADGPHADPIEPAEPEMDEEDPDQPQLAFDSGLADRLSAARETAEAVKSADVRSRSALYRALGLAYDFALAAEQDPQEYAEILEDAGVKAQDRAPMTPVVKLIFGVDYDKARLTEFAAVLSYARRQELPSGSLREHLERFPGGMKRVVEAERRARRPEQRPDPAEAARAMVHEAAPIAYVDVDFGEEVVLLLARREPDGRYAVVAPVADPKLIDRAVRSAAR